MALFTLYGQEVSINVTQPNGSTQVSLSNSSWPLQQGAPFKTLKPFTMRMKQNPHTTKNQTTRRGICRLAAVVICVAALLHCAEADTFVAADKSSGIVTVETAGGLKSYRMKPFTEIKLNGTVTTVDRLQAGMKVAVTLSDPQTASKILASGNAPTGFGAPTPEGRVAPLGSGTVTPTGGRRITLRGKFEVDEIKVKGGALWIDHQKFDKPSELQVNGVRWQPQWQGNMSERFTAFKPSLQAFADSKVEVRKLKGRGEVILTEPPTAENDHTLTVRVIDGPAGVDEYEVRITW